MTATSVLVVIPAYNEEKSIGNVICGLKASAPDYDRIIVNDGSRDKTSQVVRDLGEKQLRLATNLGYGRALQTGMIYALQHGYQVVVCLDADGQHQPEDVPGVVRALIVVLKRTTGRSMHTYSSIISYPVKTLLLSVISTRQVELIQAIAMLELALQEKGTGPSERIQTGETHVENAEPIPPLTG